MSAVVTAFSFVLVGVILKFWIDVPPRRDGVGWAYSPNSNFVEAAPERLGRILPFDPQIGSRSFVAITIASAAMFLIFPPLAMAPVVVRWVVLSRRRQRQQVAMSSELAQALPDVIDLLTLAVGSGLTPRMAFSASSMWFPEPFRDAAREVMFRCESGESFATALGSASATLGEAARPLISVLIASEADGAALLPALERAGDEARRRRRVAAEERARRIPVAMLFPLVVCVLPAFALLTVVPLLVGTFDSLQLPS